jgi:poly(3-hydroxybutyrate) depolymerase
MQMCNSRRRLFRIGTALLALTLATVVSAQEPEPKQPGGPPSSRIQKKTYDFKEAGKEMEYALFVPSRYDKEKKTPLMLALHGLGGNPQQIMRTRGLADLAEQHGYIVAAPMGYNSGGWYGLKVPAGLAKGGFGKGKREEVPKNLPELSEKDVMNVLELVRKDFTIDEKRIYLMGHSMGGGGTWHIGTKYPDIWAGLAPIAPAAFGQPTGLDKIKNTPVIVVQGDKDTLVRPEGTRRWVEKLKELEIKHEYLEIAGGGHGDVVSRGMPKIFEFFEKQQKKEDKSK